jgi:virginiamycin B lyase
MRTRSFLLVAAASLALAFLLSGASYLEGKPPDRVALSGMVSSAEEGSMEGVLVSAKKVGSSITVTVVSDRQGRYQFPADRLAPGQYSLRIRAIGYDLDGPGTVDVTTGKAAAANLKLRKTSDLASQMSNAEWLTSFPGTERQKASVRGCTHCHTLELIARSSHDAEGFEDVLERMSHYTPESFPLMIQPLRPGERLGGGELTVDQQEQRKENRVRLAQYLSTLNLSKGTEWQFPLKTLPRPKGRGTHVIVTEYDLPKRTRQPHDVIVDSQGMAWFASFGEPILGKLDPKTGKVTEYTMPVLKPGHVIGNLDIEFDKGENIWIAMTFQGAVAKFDRNTEKFQVFRLPPEMDGDYREITFVSPQNSHVDGKVWINDSGTYTQLRLDIASGKFEVFESGPVPRPNTYEVTSDAENNGWFLMFGREDVGRVDAKTGKVTTYKTPTLGSGPRRGMIDEQGRFWFGENRANRIGMFDTRTQKFQEWPVPTPEYNPYDATVDKNGNAWADTEFADSVARLDPKTGEFTEYLLPRHTNMRRTFVDNSTTPPTFWVGNNHGASIVRVEPLD